MAIQSTAVTTGSIDVNSIVSQLMTLEQRPLVLLQRKEASHQSKLTALSRVQGAVSTLQSAAAALAKAETYTGRKATVTGDGLAASAGASAVAGRYSVVISKLAAAQSLASGPLPASSTVVGTGTLTIELGTYDSVGNTFTAKPGGAPVAIAIDATKNTLAGIRDAINAANAGVTASIVNDGTGQRLTVVSKDTGAVNGVRITTTDDDAANTDASGLSQLAFDPTAAVGAGKNLTVTRAAQNAEFTVNGLAIVSASNTVTDAVEGVTLTLKKDAVGVTNEIVVDRDAAAIKAALTAFAKAWTDFDKTLDELTAYNSETRTGAELNGDSSVRSVRNLLRTLVGGTRDGGVTEYSRLSEVGLELQRDGTMTVNATRLDAAFADADKLARLFTATSDTSDAQRGFGVRIEAMTKAMLASDGQISARTKGIQASIKTLTQQQEAQARRLEMVETRLRRQYAALDAMLNTMQGRSAALANALSQIPTPQSSSNR